MCGRYGFVSPKDEVEVWQRYELSNKPKLNNTYNLAPTMKGLVVHRNSPNMGEYLPFGISASWSPSMKLINAKAETIAEKKTFKDLLENTRCLVPASFYFEWKKDGSTKQPYLFKLKNGESFSFAGIYKPEEGFIIITTEPNSLQAPIHNRMPVILPKELEQEWLNEDKTTDELLEMLVPFPSEEMITFPVSTLVNTPKNQTSEIINPISQISK